MYLYNICASLEQLEKAPSAEGSVLVLYAGIDVEVRVPGGHCGKCADCRPVFVDHEEEKVLVDWRVLLRLPSF